MEEMLRNDLLRFLYRELGPLESIDFSEKLAADPYLSDEFSSLLEAKMALPKALFEPSPESIENILRYSQKTALVQP